jgi:hypothetical protein
MHLGTSKSSKHNSTLLPTQVFCKCVVWISRQLPDGATFLRGSYHRSVLQGVSVKSPIRALRGYSASNTTPPAEAAWRSSSSHYQRSNSIAQWTFCWSMVRKRRNCAIAPLVTWPISIRFFCVELHEIHSLLEWKPDSREQLMQIINETAVSIRNELVRKQRMLSLEVHLVAWAQALGGHFEQYMWKWC